MIDSVTTKTFNTTTLSDNKYVLIYIWAPWSANCKMMEPIINEIANERGKDVIFLKQNIDENLELTTTCDVVGMPTFLFFSHGILVNNVSGIHKKNNILHFIEVARKLTIDEAKKQPNYVEIQDKNKG